MEKPWKIWFESFDENGEKIGAGVSCEEYKYKQNAVRAAKKRFSKANVKWIVSRDNPFLSERVKVEEPGDDVSEIRDALKSREGSVTYLALWDEGAGHCEIISADDEKVIIQWITFSACYSCCVYSEEIYTQKECVEYSRIAEVGSIREMSKEEIAKEREDSLDMDKCVFERFHQTMKEVEETA